MPKPEQPLRRPTTLLRLDVIAIVDPERVIAVKAQVDAEGIPNPRAGSVVILLSPHGNAIEYVPCTLSPDDAYLRITQTLRQGRTSAPAQSTS